MSSRFIDSVYVAETCEKSSPLMDVEISNFDTENQPRAELRIVYAKTKKPRSINMQDIIKSKNILQQVRALANKLDVEIEKTNDIKQILSNISNKINKMRPEALDNQVKLAKLSYYEVAYNTICFDSLDMLNL